MAFKFVLTPELTKQLEKLAVKDKAFSDAVRKKIFQIIDSDITFLNHLKNLRGDLSDYKRVHVGSFVLIFKIEEDTIIFAKLTHHDEAY